MSILKKVFPYLFLIFSLFLLVYTFYKSEIHWNGLNRDYYFAYYIISSLLIIFSIISFFINQKIKEYLIISAISIIFSLYFFEGYLLFKDEQLRKTQLKKEQLKKEKIYENQTGKKYDKRNKFEFYQDLKKKNNKVRLSLGASHYINKINKEYSIIPLSGISNTETITCSENGYYAIYQSDRYGFNNPDTEWERKEIEFLLVGDSFTRGSCVNRPNDISSVLRTLSNKSVLNLGYSGNGPLTKYASLREYLNPNVKKILWVFYEGNDLNDLRNELNNKILTNYLNDLTFSQNLKLKQKELNELANIEIEREVEKKKQEEKKENDKKFINNLLRFIKIYKIRASIFTETQSQPNLEFKKILTLAKELSIKNESKLYFVYLPVYYRYNSNFDNSVYLSVKKIVNELDIPFIDIHNEVFNKEKNPLKLFPFELWGHYNEEGYRKVSEAILKFSND